MVLSFAMCGILLVDRLHTPRTASVFLMEDVFGQLQLQVFKDIDFVEDFHSFRQKLSRCISVHGKHSEYDLRNLCRIQPRKLSPPQSEQGNHCDNWLGICGEVCHW